MGTGTKAFGGKSNNLRCLTLGRSLSNNRGKIQKPAFLEKSGWENGVLTLDDVRAFTIFQALLVFAPGGRFFGGPAFQIEAFLGRFHWEK